MNQNSGLERYISPVSVWALSFGSAVGWGAFIMPGSTFIPIAGPLGSALGMTLGALVMILIGVNYQFMMNRYPEVGGTYAYTKHLFGHDHAFLSAWFLSLTYIAITWANVTALALIGRNMFGSLLQFGFYYSVAGYSIYFGEVLFEIVVLALVALLCMFAKKTALLAQTLLAVVLIAGVLFCFFAVTHASSFSTVFKSAFAAQNEGKTSLIPILSIAALSPWAFVGFESVSHSVQEFKFPHKKTLPLMLLAVLTGLGSYILLTFVAVPSYKLVGMPIFFAVKSFAGQAGFVVLCVAVIAAILTGIIGNSIAASRLLYALAEDGVLPGVFKKRSANGVPRNAILLITISSAVIPFLGRTAIGWIVDVTTIGATIAYGYTSACAFKAAKDEENLPVCITGVIGFFMSIFFSFFLLVPNFWSINALAPESYLILAFWSVVGFIYFRSVFTHDSERRFGRSTVVWIALLFLIFFTSIMWMRQATHKTAETVLGDISTFYIDQMGSRGIVADKEFTQTTEAFLDGKLNTILDALLDNSLVQLVMIVIALAIMFSVYSKMRNREKTLEEERNEEKRANEAKTTFLSNMSHDIRTPMNAIIGYTKLARRENVTIEEMRDFLAKIDSSSKHLLALINDVLEMSRIESGKMEMELSQTNLKTVMEEVRDMFATQMQSKSILYLIDYNLRNPIVRCDRNRLNRVLLNLIGNAYKFTDENGTISVSLYEKEFENDEEQEKNYAMYELRVKDNGVGMSKEFAERVFDAFERERTSTVSGIQGTGLGMAITKSIVDLMGGEISVHTDRGEGTEFVIQLPFEVVKHSGENESAVSETEHAKASAEQIEENSAEEGGTIDFTGKRLLLVDDVEVNREIAAMLLGEMGFVVETASNGKEAVEKVWAAEAGYYACVLMDIQMPEMNGYEATKKIREFSDKAKASVPIVAMTANAFEEDKRNAFMAGMNAHVAKPIDEEHLLSVLKFVLR